MYTFVAPQGYATVATTGQPIAPMSAHTTTTATNSNHAPSLYYYYQPQPQQQQVFYGLPHAAESGPGAYCFINPDGSTTGALVATAAATGGDRHSPLLPRVFPGGSCAPVNLMGVSTTSSASHYYQQQPQQYLQQQPTFIYVTPSSSDNTITTDDALAGSMSLDAQIQALAHQMLMQQQLNSNCGSNMQPQPHTQHAPPPPPQYAVFPTANSSNGAAGGASTAAASGANNASANNGAPIIMMMPTSQPQQQQLQAESVSNGVGYDINATYEGYVKRYNPAKGFGFFTATHIVPNTSSTTDADAASDADANDGDGDDGIASGNNTNLATNTNTPEVVRVPVQAGDIFVHQSYVHMLGFRSLPVGGLVRFRIGYLRGQRSLQAIDVHLLSTPKSSLTSAPRIATATATALMMSSNTMHPPQPSAAALLSSGRLPGAHSSTTSSGCGGGGGGGGGVSIGSSKKYSNNISGAGDGKDRKGTPTSTVPLDENCTGGGLIISGRRGAYSLSGTNAPNSPTATTTTTTLTTTQSRPHTVSPAAIVMNQKKRSSSSSDTPSSPTAVLCECSLLSLVGSEEMAAAAAAATTSREDDDDDDDDDGDDDDDDDGDGDGDGNDDDDDYDEEREDEDVFTLIHLATDVLSHMEPTTPIY